MTQRKKIAAIITTFYPASHADVIVTKFVRGFPTDEGLLHPKVDIVSMYMDQIHQNDIGLDLAERNSDLWRRLDMRWDVFRQLGC